jgi:hypothetical protein
MPAKRQTERSPKGPLEIRGQHDSAAPPHSQFQPFRNIAVPQRLLTVVISV